MEVWTFIHKETNEIIRFDTRAGCSEFGEQYYFTTFKYSPFWFVITEKDAISAYKEFVHPQFSINYNQPATDKININDYKICKFST